MPAELELQDGRHSLSLVSPLQHSLRVSAIAILSLTVRLTHRVGSFASLIQALGHVRVVAILQAAAGSLTIETAVLGLTGGGVGLSSGYKALHIT